MNLQITDSWLREYLATKAKPKDIAKYVSLCGPTFDRTTKAGKDWIYDIEVTSNRVDAMSVYGIAREIAAILPQFGVAARLERLNLAKPKTPRKSLPFKVVSNKNLVYRTIGVVVEDIKRWKSPEWMKQRLEAAGIRSLNSVVDITNYVMVEIGHPMHAFDYDKIPEATLIIRESKKGEKIVSLDNKKYSLPGGDIVFQSAKGEIIDLPGIIGTKNSVVSRNTKRVLFFVDNNDSSRIRKSSMILGIRTMAATINEKGVDRELGMQAIIRAVDLAQQVCGAKIASKIYDNYVSKTKPKSVVVNHDFIKSKLGIDIAKSQIGKILIGLGFETKWSGNILTTKVPSFRLNDVSIAEDIVEEIARIYGYHNLPSRIMEGEIPDSDYDSPFAFENKIRDLLVAAGGNEVYTYSLVPRHWVKDPYLKLKNPLGADTEYLRTSMEPSLVDAARQNKGEDDPYHLFEIANIYVAKSNALPEERMMLAGVMVGYSYRRAKGVVEMMLTRLGIEYKLLIEERIGFLPGGRVVVKSEDGRIGEYGVLEGDNFYYEFDTGMLRQVGESVRTFIPIPKYPAQIEDITFKLPKQTRVGDVQHEVLQVKQIGKVELRDIYKDSHTFRIWYQDVKKTLTDKEVVEIRKKVIGVVQNKFGGIVKD